MNPLDTLPDFERYVYRHIHRPNSPKLIAWSKAEECERRFGWYSWIEGNNAQADPRHLVLLNDSLSAFLLTFESAIQHAKDQYDDAHGGQVFDSWIRAQPEYDELLKGIRSLRHLDAHVESYRVAGHITVEVGSAQKFTRRWSLQELQEADLNRLSRSQLKAADLPKWNRLVQAQTAQFLLGSALDRLNSFLLRLEALV